MTTPQRRAWLSVARARSSVSKGPKMPTVIYRHRVRSVQKGSLQKVDISSKGRRNVARAPQVPMLHQDQLRPTVWRVQRVELTMTTTSGRHAKNAVLGPSRQTTRTSWSLRTQRHVRVAHPGRLMATRTLAPHALYVQSARRTQQHDPSTKVRAYDATPGGGLTVKEWQGAQSVQKGPTAAQTILMDACPAMHPKGPSVESARDTLARRLDILQSSWYPLMVATRHS